MAPVIVLLEVVKQRLYVSLSVLFLFIYYFLPSMYDGVIFDHFFFDRAFLLPLVMASQIASSIT